MREILFNDLGTIEYVKAWQLQEKYLGKNLELKAAAYKSSEKIQPLEIGTKNYLLFCEHPHVLTLGKSGHLENLLLNDVRLKELGISFHNTNRGGDITYHGPGQIVGYPILDLELFFTDLGKYMRCLEEVIIRTIGHYGIKGERLPGSTGVWLDVNEKAKARKICAMGVRCSRWVTIHGFALNVNTDLKYFGYIVPCGIGDKSVTSMQQELGKDLDEDEVKSILKKEIENVFEATIIEHQEATTSY